MKKNTPFSKINSRELVGIDLSGNSLKIACLNAGSAKKEISSLLSRNIDGVSDEHISKIIGASLEGMKLKSPQVVITIPSHSVITKNIEIPSTDPKEIKDIISLQAERHTPYTREEIIVDYLDLGSYKRSYSKILLVIIARKVVEKQLKILDKTGFTVERVAFAPESYAGFFQKSLKIENADLPVSVVHIEQDFTDFAVIFKNKVLFVRSIPIGCRHFSEAREMSQDKFIEELKKSLELYQSEDIEKLPGLIVLAGAIEGLKDFETALHHSLQIPVKTYSYLKNLAFSSGLLSDTSITKQGSFLNVIAPLLALQETKINLIPEEVKLRKALEERARELIKTGVLVLTAFILIFSTLFSKIYFKSAYLKVLNDKYESLNKETQKLKNDFLKVSLIRDYLSKRGYSLEVLAELYNALSLQLEINEIRFDGQGKFSLKGTSESMSEVFSFVDSMGKSKYFKDVKTKHTTKRKEGSKDLTDFEITALLSKETAK